MNVGMYDKSILSELTQIRELLTLLVPDDRLAELEARREQERNDAEQRRYDLTLDWIGR